MDDTGSSPVLYFIHTDQIGTPQKITDGSLNIVWDGVFDPFGNQATGSSLSLTNLRFPGQYFDGESGLNQNWRRDYDPTTGRYIQSDPLGLFGGTNTYAYVGGNPTGRTDSAGLWQLTVTVGWGPAGQLTFGQNGGQWNVGVHVGAGIGASINWNPEDTGCKTRGFNPGVTSQADVKVGNVAVGLNSNVTMRGNSSSVDVPALGIPSIPDGPVATTDVLDPTRSPNGVGYGGVLFVGTGGQVYW